VSRVARVRSTRERSARRALLRRGTVPNENAVTALFVPGLRCRRPRLLPAPRCLGRQHLLGRGDPGHRRLRRRLLRAHHQDPLDRAAPRDRAQGDPPRGRDLRPQRRRGQDHAHRGGAEPPRQVGSDNVMRRVESFAWPPWRGFTRQTPVCAVGHCVSRIPRTRRTPTGASPACRRERPRDCRPRPPGSRGEGLTQETPSAYG